VKIGLDAIMRERPDAVFSGINAGSNLSTNLIYSGTVSAAIEGAIMGICSVAISVCRTDEIQYDYAGEFALQLLEVLAGKGFPKVLLNVNIPPVPPAEVKGVRLTRQGGMQFRDYFDKRQDPAGRTYYWLTGEMVNTEEHPETDSNAIDEGYVSITPIQYNLTDERLLEELKGWDFTQ
jgi:5'-nucleotidase